MGSGTDGAMGMIIILIMALLIAWILFSIAHIFADNKDVEKTNEMQRMIHCEYVLGGYWYNHECWMRTKAV